MTNFASVDDASPVEDMSDSTQQQRPHQVSSPQLSNYHHTYSSQPQPPSFLADSLAHTDRTAFANSSRQNLIDNEQQRSPSVNR
jgi:hypothetical protein